MMRPVSILAVTGVLGAAFGAFSLGSSLGGSPQTPSPMPIELRFPLSQAKEYCSPIGIVETVLERSKSVDLTIRDGEHVYDVRFMSSLFFPKEVFLEEVSKGDTVMFGPFDCDIGGKVYLSTHNIGLYSREMPITLETSL